MVVDDVKKRMEDPNAITNLISEKIIQKTSALVEAKKQECQTIIDALKEESTEAMDGLNLAVQKLKLLHEGNQEKADALDKQYHEALSSITVLQAKLETLGAELRDKMKVVEGGFLQLFETEEEAKQKRERFQERLSLDRKRVNFIIKKLFGTPYDNDETNRSSLMHRLIVLERGKEKRDEVIDALSKRVQQLESEQKLLKEEIKRVEQKSVAHIVARITKPFKKVTDEIVLAVIKSLVIKLLIGALLAMGAIHTLQDLDFFNLLIEELF